MLSRREPRIRVVALAMALAVLAGCVGPSTPGGGAPAPAEAAAPATRPVVVALLDTGVDPYHAAFASGAPASWPAASGALPVALAREGAWEERRAADEGAWDSLRPDTLYRFDGTRVAAISMLDGSAGPLVLDANGHGTATASIVARDDPRALLVVVQVDPSLCDGRECLLSPTLARGMRWAAEQDWIDVISTSVGMPTNTPDASALHPEVRAFLEASEMAHASGKILVNAAGNMVAPPALSYVNGPPWVIAVGGSKSAAKGETLFSAKGVDVVANSTQPAALAGTLDGYAFQYGTSFSAPTVAATLSRAIATLRERADAPAAGADRFGGFSAAALRDALNLTAEPFAATDWDPTTRPGNDTLSDAASPSVPVVLAPAQMGWGEVRAEMADEIARRLLEGDLAPGPAQAHAALHQGAYQRAREAAWAALRDA